MHYFANNNAIIFVVDSSDVERIGEASDTLNSLLQNEQLIGAPLLVFANK